MLFLVYLFLNSVNFFRFFILNVVMSLYDIDSMFRVIIYDGRVVE